MNMKLSMSVCVLGLMGILGGALAQTTQAATVPSAPGQRLIQIGAERRWLSENQVLQLIAKSHAAGHCGGFMDVTDHPEPKSARSFRAVIPQFGPRTPAHPELVQPMIAHLSADRLMKGISKLASFKSRYYKSDTGIDSMKWIASEFQAIARNRSDATVEMFTHRFPQPSVIARIQGKGPHANERVILGAHGDSINLRGGTGAPAPGADDDASGVATLLETYYVLTQSGYKPDRTIEFIAYAGEEAGLLGSQDIAADYKKKGIPVAGVLQMDMTGYPGHSHSIHLISDHVDQELTKFIATLIDTYVKTPWQLSPCGYACSDHASWTAENYASAFPFESDIHDDNPKIHSAEDTIDMLDASFGLQFAKVSVAFAVEMATAPALFRP